MICHSIGHSIGYSISPAVDHPDGVQNWLMAQVSIDAPGQSLLSVAYYSIARRLLASIIPSTLTMNFEQTASTRCSRAFLSMQELRHVEDFFLRTSCLQHARCWVCRPTLATRRAARCMCTDCLGCLFAPAAYPSICRFLPASHFFSSYPICP